MKRWFPPPLRLTWRPITLALLVAIVTDAIQLATAPFGWAGLDQILDVVAMILTSSLLGFHLLLLPTFVLEFIPLVQVLPTWTGCVALLSWWRWKEERSRRKENIVVSADPPQITRGRR